MKRLLFVFLVLAAAGAAEARHPEIRSEVWAVVGADRIDVRVMASLEEPLVARELRPGPDGTYDPSALSAAVRDHAAYVGDHLRVLADGVALRGRRVRSAL